jgi:hypothetical protein
MGRHSLFLSLSGGLNSLFRCLWLPGLWWLRRFRRSLSLLLRCRRGSSGWSSSLFSLRGLLYRFRRLLLGGLF